MPDMLPTLVCLPHAGGSGATYRQWPDLLAGLADVRPVTLPGRAERWHQPLPRDLAEPAAAFAAEFAASPGPVALFGHSLGGLLGFEIARLLTARGRAPMLLVVAASPPPDRLPAVRDRHLLPDPEFTAWVRELGGTAEEILADAEMSRIVLPILRADVGLSERYRYRPGAPLPVPIVTIAGHADPEAGPAAMAGWAAHSALPVREFQVEGGHMFVEHQQAAVLTVLRDVLAGPAVGRSVR